MRYLFTPCCSTELQLDCGSRISFCVSTRAQAILGGLGWTSVDEIWPLKFCNLASCAHWKTCSFGDVSYDYESWHIFQRSHFGTEPKNCSRGDLHGLVVIMFHHAIWETNFLRKEWTQWRKRAFCGIIGWNYYFQRSLFTTIPAGWMHSSKRELGIYLVQIDLTNGIAKVLAKFICFVRQKKAEVSSISFQLRWLSQWLKNSNEIANRIVEYIPAA